MAKTNSRYFEPAKNLLGVTSLPTPIKVLIANSTQLKIGQFARINTAGFAVAAGVGNAIAGRIAGFIDNGGLPVDSFGYTGATGHTNSGDDTITTASDNQTRSFPVYAEIEVATGYQLYYNQANGNLAQTNLFQFFNLVSTSDQVDQATASDTAGQVQLIELDPLKASDLTAGLFAVAQRQLLLYSSGTIIAA